MVSVSSRLPVITGSSSGRSTVLAAPCCKRATTYHTAPAASSASASTAIRMIFSVFFMALRLSSQVLRAARACGRTDSYHYSIVYYKKK